MYSGVGGDRARRGSGSGGCSRVRDHTPCWSARFAQGVLSWGWGVLRPQLVALFPPLPPPQQDIVAEKGRQNDLNVDTELHMVDIFNRCRAGKLWERKGGE